MHFVSIVTSNLLRVAQISGSKKAGYVQSAGQNNKL